ncbi:14082_t:CDS:1, partial [Funneliformis geosporum]
MNQWLAPVKIYGITQDPETLNVMVVLQEMNLGSLRSNLMIKKYNPNDKYMDLYAITRMLSALHDCNLIHGDFHSGNLLLKSLHIINISDFGLSKPANESNKSNKIYGVLPYIAPEVLRGKPFTKAADIYSLGIIMWEMTSGIPAFNSVPHDFNLSLDICKGLRPKIVKDTMPEYAELMERCWDSNADNRPTAKELVGYFVKWQNEFSSIYTERIPIP